eukprot:1384107-Heterocapsa_arctica.AAC.1
MAGGAVVTPSAPPTTRVSSLAAFWASEVRGQRDESLLENPKPKAKAVPLAITPLQAAQNHA